MLTQGMKFFILSLLFLARAMAAENTSELKSMDLLTGKEVSISWQGKSSNEKKGTVVVFLSAHCPCSNSHIEELSTLASEYKDFTFIGVHSNSDEGKEETVQYFKEAKLPFVILQDSKGTIADHFKALKTPHAFLVRPDGSIAYKGGVSNSRNFPNADKKFLRLALENIRAGEPVKISEGRTLGCTITRGESNVW